MFRGFPLKCSVRGFAPDTPYGIFYKILRPTGSGFYKKFFQKQKKQGGTEMTDFMKYARRRGLVPDWAWYQINGQSAQENWMEQREKMYQSLADQQDAEDDTPNFIFTSEVKLK